MDSPKARFALLIAFAVGMAVLESWGGRCERCAAIPLLDRPAGQAAETPDR